jgi:effector-binding domain-containing protein
MSGNLMYFIRECMDEVWGFIREKDVSPAGHNVILYQPVPGSRETEAWFGVEAPETMPHSPTVSKIRTPAGRVVMVTHIGPYSGLGEAHAAIRRWCRENGHALAGANWEIYGDWQDDESKLRTDVFYMLV